MVIARTPVIHAVVRIGTPSLIHASKRQTVAFRTPIPTPRRDVGIAAAGTAAAATVTRVLANRGAVAIAQVVTYSA